MIKLCSANAVLFSMVLFFLGAMDANANPNPRIKHTINSDWYFYKGDVKSHNEFKELDWVPVSIPHTWNDKDVKDDEPGYYRGVSWYKKELHISTSKEKEIFLHFEGANQETEVYVNGKKAGSHIGGYTAFTFPIAEFLNHAEDNKPAKNEIWVKVDNSFNESIPPLSADFTFFGGIYRDVYLIETSAVHFTMTDYASKGIYITTPEVTEKSANVHIRGKIINEAAQKSKVKVKTTILDQNNQVVATKDNEFAIKAGGVVGIDQLFKQISNPILWSPDNPYLYRVVTSIYNKKGDLLDEVDNPLGFRWFEFDAKEGFSLNGKPLKLMGTNRHQDYNDLGNALPNALHINDVQLLKDLGGNFLRVAHYPQDPEILEACDRLGILASVEIPIVNAITESEAFYNNSKEMQIEMIRQNFNHPSVIIWAYMNEVLLRPKFNDDSIRKEKYFQNIAKLAQELEDIARREDPYRYTMIPNHGAFDLYKRVGLTDIPMIVGWNLYQGWYGANIKGFANYLDRHAKELGHKPVIITEYGADADPRLRSFNPERFDMTVEYANFYHEVYLHEILKRPFVAGATVWNLADFYSETRGDVVPHVNNKGLVGLDRVPKDTYFYYQANLLKKPFLKIASSNWKIRSGVTDNKALTCEQPLQVFTNLESAYLIVNGTQLENKKSNNKKIEWIVPFVNGINMIEAIGEKDGQTIKDYLEVDFRMQHKHLANEQLPFKEISVNLGTKERIFIDDLRKKIWLPDQPYEKGSWGYIGGETYVMENNKRQSYGTDQNIRGTALDPVYQTQQTGIKQYKLDVPDGVYDIDIHLAILEDDSEKEALAYNLDDEKMSKAENVDRLLSLSINGQVLMKELDVVNVYGAQKAIQRKIRIRVDKGQGILVDFNATIGHAFLNGIEVKKVY